MRRRQTAGILLASPWILTFLAFWLFPLIYSLFLSFTDYRLLRPSYNWVGLQNFFRLFSDTIFLDSLKNTFIFVLGTIPVTTIISLILALLIDKNFRGRTLFRSGFFMPSITSMVVIALIFTNLYSRGGYISLWPGWQDWLLPKMASCCPIKPPCCRSWPWMSGCPSDITCCSF